ncbi:hypothetical protein BKA82DRAFT_1004534 [Pisolithus tinctorius]|uniref:Uncharacterized protein n=1 Tax=Pisolithus tinctorius Marx 270 TaxID=870435 RepID=A0A0C3IRN8_PISTI|nr:hypothetical protein BKA82DRAFT_1004534 [Pisolithus tinctorius]KIN99592.1 hypothetical protein M404DRAFT_1004534 [Pisolithus tinctorius Marx 270]
MSDVSFGFHLRPQFNIGNVPIWIFGDFAITSLIVAEICGSIWNSALVPILMLLSVRQLID